MRSIFILCFSLLCFDSAFGAAQIVVDPNIKYQTITGWEATAEAGEFHVSFPIYSEELFDRVVSELGISRLRVEVPSSIENPVDFFNPNGTNEEKHPIVNDNSNPFRINPAGFQFSRLDHKMKTVVLPIAKRLRARGERLFLNVTYVDFGRSVFEHKTHPDEYAEFVLATYLHLKRKFNLVPDVWEIILEPDHAAWDPEQVANCTLAAAKKLKSHGFKPSFIVPSAANMKTSLSYFERILRTPGLLPYIHEFSYHRYSGVSNKTLREISAQGKKYGVHTAMLEHIGSGYEDLHRDLKMGNVSSWQQYTLAFPGATETGGKYYLLDLTNVQQPFVIKASRTRFLRQYFHFIRRGAVRIEATSDSVNFNPVAFINKNGKHVVVVKVKDGGDFSITGLPGGTYGIRYTTSEETAVSLPNVSSRSGHLSASIPARGVITIFQR